MDPVVFLFDFYESTGGFICKTWEVIPKFNFIQ